MISNNEAGKRIPIPKFWKIFERRSSGGQINNHQEIWRTLQNLLDFDKNFWF